MFEAGEKSYVEIEFSVPFELTQEQLTSKDASVFLEAGEDDSKTALDLTSVEVDYEPQENYTKVIVALTSPDGHEVKPGVVVLNVESAQHEHQHRVNIVPGNEFLSFTQISCMRKTT